MIGISLQIFLIAFSLALDAVGVSIVGGMKCKGLKVIHAIKVAASFGLFQAVMPLFGWFLGEAMKGVMVSAGYWVAFILLVVIGAKMLWEALNENKNHKEIVNIKVLILLSIATSIDALIIGVTLPLLGVPLFVSVSLIGLVTFVLSFLGFMFGKQLSMLFGKKVEILGGLALIAIGFKILLEHLVI